jgi:hypothetical protein
MNQVMQDGTKAATEKVQPDIEAVRSALLSSGQPELVTSSKMAIFLASLTAGVAGYPWLQAFGKSLALDDDVETMDFEQQPGRGLR